MSKRTMLRNGKARKMRKQARWMRLRRRCQRLVGTRHLALNCWFRADHKKRWSAPRWGLQSFVGNMRRPGHYSSEDQHSWGRPGQTIVFCGLPARVFLDGILSQTVTSLVSGAQHHFRDMAACRFAYTGGAPLAAGRADRQDRARCPPVWRGGSPILRPLRVGDHAKPRARGVGTARADARDHALVEGQDQPSHQPSARKERTGVLAGGILRSLDPIE